MSSTAADFGCKQLVKAARYIAPLLMLERGGGRVFSKKKSGTAEAELQAIGKPRAIVYFTPDGTIIDANFNFLQVTGYTLGEIKGQNHRIFVDPADAQSEDYRRFWEKLRRAEPQSAQFRRLGKGDKEIWLRASYNPVIDSSGKPMIVADYAFDITQRRREAAEFDEFCSSIFSQYPFP
jgi:methyl-accepting chemotaxis protein